MGWRSQPTRQVQFDDCDIPAENLLGNEGDGFKYAMMGLDGGRLNIAACSLGAAQTAINQTLTYMGERKAFGKPISKFQNSQFGGSFFPKSILTFEIELVICEMVV